MRPAHSQHVDWNWYYAALAQSFAAIVGIGGAFLVARLMAHESSRREWLRDATNWTAEVAHHHIECKALSTDWLNQQERQDDDWFLDRAKGVHKEQGPLDIRSWLVELIDGFGWHERPDRMEAHIRNLLPANFVTKGGS